MKRVLFSLLALAFCLSACGAATVPESEAPAAVTEETASTVESAEATAIVGTLRRMDDCDNTGTVRYLQGVEGNGGNYADKGYIQQIDYTTAQQRRLFDTGKPAAFFQNCFVQGDTLHYILRSEKSQILYSRNLVSGDTRTVPLGDAYYIGYLDDRYLYLFPAGYNEYTVMRRLDPATGEVEETNLPAQTTDICDADGSRFLITRLHSDLPMSSLQGEEQRTAALQNATVEYAWWDPADGSVETVLEEPYYGDREETGLEQVRTYLGKADGKLYFFRASLQGAGYANGRIECCALDGSGAQTVFAAQEGANPLKQKGEIQWFVHSTGKTQIIYRLADSTQYEVPAKTEEELIDPVALTDDGRVLLAKFDRSLEKGITYCLVSEMDYLAGNFTGTDVTPAED